MKLYLTGEPCSQQRHCYFVQGNQVSFIVDCGYQRCYAGDELPHLTPEQIRSARYLFLTHSHENQSGALEHLYNMGFQGKTDYSYAAAIAIGVFIITILLATMINQAIKERRFNQWWYLLLMMITIIIGFALYMWTRMFIFMLASGYVGVGIVTIHHMLYEKRRNNS